MRLFIAFQLSDSVKDALVSVQDAMRRGGARGNYTAGRGGITPKLKISI